MKHPVFARVYERFAQAAEEKGQAALRARALAGAHGRVVEVGAGNGMNFAHYPAAVEEIVAVEPEPYLREKARGRATERIRVVEGDAEHLPVGDASADVVVFSLVLCSVPSPPAALAEARRVLKPGGTVLFYEHVISHRRGKAAFQRAFTRTLWKRMAGGCHLDRDTGTAIAEAGFVVDELDRVSFQGLPHILGRARLA